MYATVDQISDEIKGNDSEQTNGLLRAIRYVMGRIDDLTNRTFEPLIAEKRYNAYGDHISDIDVPTIKIDYFLSLTSVKIETTTITDWAIYPYNSFPISVLRRTDNKDWHEFETTPIEAIRVSGILGYNKARTYSECYQTVDSIQSAITTTTQNYFIVSDFAGIDTFGIRPRLSIGSFVKIDDEFMEVYDIDASAQKVYVRRGINGSTAATHLINASVMTYICNPLIIRATQRWVAYIHQRIGSFENFTVDGGGTVQFPIDVPEEVQNILSRLTFREWKAV